jgi:hypothetical protein
MSNIRVFHNVANGPNVDVYVDNVKKVGNLSYESNTSYVSVSPGSHVIDVKVSGTNNVVIGPVSISTEARKNYTIIAHGSVSDLSTLDLLLTEDGFGMCPRRNNLKLRVIHSDGDASDVAVDISIDGNIVIDELKYGEVSEYESLDTSKHFVKVLSSENGSVLLQTPLQLKGGKMYSIHAIGIPGDSNSPFGVKILVDSGNCYIDTE